MIKYFIHASTFLIFSLSLTSNIHAEVMQSTAKAVETEMRDQDKGPVEHLLFRPSEVVWQAGPASFESGAQVAVLEGSPGASGVFTMQLKFPDGFVINPHFHPNVERLTVLAGTFYLGSGTVVDKDQAEALPAGSYTSMPKKMIHYAIAEGETIVQLSSIGPWEISYVDPSHDPRLRK